MIISLHFSFFYVHLHKLPINGIDNFANICILFPAVVKFVSLHGVDVHTVFFAPSGSFAIVWNVESGKFSFKLQSHAKMHIKPDVKESCCGWYAGSNKLFQEKLEP